VAAPRLRDGESWLDAPTHDEEAAARGNAFIDAHSAMHPHGAGLGVQSEPRISVSRPRPRASKRKPPAEVGSAGGESGAFAWAAPPWWSGTRCWRRSVSAPAMHVRTCVRGTALRTPCAPCRCETDPSTRQPSVSLPEPCELRRVCRSPQQTPGRVTMRDVRLPFLSCGLPLLHRGRNSGRLSHLLWRMVSRCSGIASALPPVSSRTRLVRTSAVRRARPCLPPCGGSVCPSSPPGGGRVVTSPARQLQPMLLPQFRQR
jgi:hypothetical protein